jgi:hypothetical protein
MVWCVNGPSSSVLCTKNQNPSLFPRQARDTSIRRLFKHLEKSWRGFAEALGPEGLVVDADIGHACAFAGPLRHAGYPITRGGKTASFFEFSLSLSRACLGKTIVFIYKWLKNAVFRRHALHSRAVLLRRGLCVRRAGERLRCKARLRWASCASKGDAECGRYVPLGACEPRTDKKRQKDCCVLNRGTRQQLQLKRGSINCQDRLWTIRMTTHKSPLSYRRVSARR